MSIFSKNASESNGVSYISDKYGVTPKPVKSDTNGIDCLFSVYDKVCQEFNPPFVCKNLAVAMRSMRDTLKGQQTLVSMHPEDYSLVCIGYFDNSTGIVNSCCIDSNSFIPVTKILGLDEVSEDLKDEIS